MKTVNFFFRTQGLVLFFFLILMSCNDKIKTEIDIKNDTLKVLNIQQKQELESNGFYAAENYIIANKALIRNSTMNDSARNVIDSLKFGDKIYTKNVYYDEEEGISGDESLIKDERKNGFVAIYTQKPTNLKDKPIGYISEKVLVEEYEFENYKKYFSLPEFRKLDSKIKRIIMENAYLDGKSYYLTQNSQKAPHVFTTGDFDGDGAKDYAFILDNVDNQYSCVLILLINKATKEPYVAYRKAYSDMLKIKLNKKGEMIPSRSKEDENEIVENVKSNLDAITTVYNGNLNFITYLYNNNSDKFDEIEN